MINRNSLRLNRDDSGRAKILGGPIQTLGDDKIRIRENVHEIGPEIHETLASTRESGKLMKKDSSFLIDE